MGAGQKLKTEKELTAVVRIALAGGFFVRISSAFFWGSLANANAPEIVALQFFIDSGLNIVSLEFLYRSLFVCSVFSWPFSAIAVLITSTP